LHDKKGAKNTIPFPALAMVLKIVSAVLLLNSRHYRVPGSRESTLHPYTKGSTLSIPFLPLSIYLFSKKAPCLFLGFKLYPYLHTKSCRRFMCQIDSLPGIALQLPYMPT
jgi:hypothetical protein